MPLNENIKKVMVIGSGPIVIGQAAEFDYAGTQACRALREEGIEVVLVNSNPATIMTDNHIADKIYIEPLTITVIERIIKKEKPDSLLSTLGWQTGLTMSMQLAKSGFLDKHGVRLLGANPVTIDKAEDRQIFKDTMIEIGQPIIPSKVVTNLEDANAFAREVGFPLIIRPAFTLGGSGGGTCHNFEQLAEIAGGGIRMSPIGQVLVEQSIAGWKEIEFEVMRDSQDNAVIVCPMENIDPVGVHTGDSIVAAPTLTLTDEEFQLLRKASLDIVRELAIEGGCNVQLALKPDSLEYMVIEVNPRVSRSSALASKATGYPIARVATKVAIGYTLDEIKDPVTGKRGAFFEPAPNYIVVKFPKWPFDKFVYADRTLGTQMKATGEVMAIGSSFEEAMMKAVRGAEIGKDCFIDKTLSAQTDEEVIARLHDVTDERIFVVYEALRRGVSIEQIFDITKITRFFLQKMKNLADMEKKLADNFDDGLYAEAKKMGWPDNVIERLSGQTVKNPLRASYKIVDTCGGEFSSDTPYFYSVYDAENEAAMFKAARKTDKKTVIVFGSGPIRIGQGIEFDYASVHCVWALRKAGYDVVIVNNNPETVSTDFDTADRLYFEALTQEDVLSILETEKPYAAVVAFGGQTAIKLTTFLDGIGVKILGTPAESIDAAEDREKFEEILETLQLRRPEAATVMTEGEALAAAARIGYPVLMRPSYVLGGQNMIIAYSEEDIREYMEIILRHDIENPVLIDKYMRGIELEIDAISDGTDVLIPGIMEHVERTGVHSGDSIAEYPAWNVDDEMSEKIIDHTKRLAKELKVVGIVNIQLLINVSDQELYVIEVNPRSSRTVPYISKVTGVPMIELATRCMLGERLRDMGFGVGLLKKSPYFAAKVPMFSFEKLLNVDSQLGPEMKSTGEVLGIASTRDETLYKGMLAAGYKMNKKGGVFISVRDQDKVEAVSVARKFANLGFSIYATKGTAACLESAGLFTHRVDKIYESSNNSLALIENGKVDYVISTSKKGRDPEKDAAKIRRKAVERSIPCVTSVDTADAVVDCLLSKYSASTIELVDINNMRQNRHWKLPFTKMQTYGNDYIYLDCRNIDPSSPESPTANPESLSIRLCDRQLGIGGDGLVIIERSNNADVSVSMYNMDGSSGSMGGNALQCVCKYLYDGGIARKPELTIEADGVVHLMWVYTTGDKVTAVKTNMGKAVWSPDLIPLTLPAGFWGTVVSPGGAVGLKEHAGMVKNMPVTIGARDFNINCLALKKPHCVVFVEDLHSIDLSVVGPAFENHPIFPNGVKTEFVHVLDRSTLLLRVWERGDGETKASGSGACAAAAAAILNGYCDVNTDITVKLKGGNIMVRCTEDGDIFMTCGVSSCFSGMIEI